MRLFIMLAFVLSILGAFGSAYFVWLQFNKDELEINKSWKAFEKKFYADCKVMWQTAQTEQSVYGTIISGSVYNHVQNCVHCQYVLDGKPELLVKHRENMRELERSWKDERRASNTT